MTLYVEQADFHDVPDDSSLERHGDAGTGGTSTTDHDQDTGCDSSSFRSVGGESSTSARSLHQTQRNNQTCEASSNDPCSPRSMSAVAAAPEAPSSPLHVSTTANRRSSLPSNRSKSEEYLFSVTLRDQLLDWSSDDTERIVAENLESTKTITQLKLQLAEALSTLDNLQHSNQLLGQSLRCAKDEAYAHSAQHRKELSSLREELLKVKKDRDDLTTELRHIREERDDARREVTRMTMLSIQQQQRSQRRLSSDTTESTLSMASSMGSHGGVGIGVSGGGRRGSLLQNFCDSSRHLLGGGGNAHTNSDAPSNNSNAAPVNRRGSLTIADLQNSRRSIMLSQQGNSSNGRIQGRRGSVSIIIFACWMALNECAYIIYLTRPSAMLRVLFHIWSKIHYFVHQATTNSASLALALANANANGNGTSTSTSNSQPRHSSNINLQELRSTSSEQSRRSSGGSQWFRRLSNLGAVSKGSSYDASFENSQDSFSSILGLDRELDKLEEQQANADGNSNLMLPGRGASPLTTPNAITQDANADDDDDDDDELSEDDEEAIRNAAGIFGCNKEGRNDSQNLPSSQVDAVGWTSRLKLPEENTEEKTADISADDTFALGEESVRRNSMTARNA